MRVHLPALIVLASATSYVACGSSNDSKAVQESGGAGGEAGEGTSAGGSNSSAGSKNGAGSPNMSGGQAGDGSGGVPATGQGGASAGDGGMLGGAAGTDAGGAGGEMPVDMSLPAECPGVLADYTLLAGSDADDTFTLQDVAGKKLIFGLDGFDTFPKEHGGEDCIVGGPGDDDFTNSDEFANYYVGGAGADTYHIDTTGNYVHIADLASEDEIALSKAKFTFLVGNAGDTPDATQVKAVAGYSTGTSSGVIEGSSIIYDPTSGELWFDYDGGIKGSSVNDQQILTVIDKDTYTFDIEDFVLE